MSTFFITRYDDAKRDGGRDGLGLLPIWSRLARQCIWNVTSISSDLAGWRSLLACAAIEALRAGAESLGGLKGAMNVVGGWRASPQE